MNALDDAGETLLVPAAEWESYLEALDAGPEPPRVVLVGPGAPPDAVAYVDDAVPDDADAIASAVRLSGSEIGRALSDATGVELRQVAEALTLDALPASLQLPPLAPDDLPRVAAAARREVQTRWALRPRPTGTAVADERAPAEEVASAVAAAVLVGLLRAGLRLGASPILRGEDTGPAGSVADQVAEVFDRGGVVPAELGGVAVDFALDGDTMVIRGERPVRVTIGVPGTAPEVDETGRRVAVPVGALRGRRVAVSIGS
ncbi:hypothetical protein [Rubrivirga sp. IMCC43871]|uniref:hypothetical protein n=1 Tax=Rubrivirga sp. IMCC43871 TaxID=3391575 RepID=UPI00399031E6